MAKRGLLILTMAVEDLFLMASTIFLTEVIIAKGNHSWSPYQFQLTLIMAEVLMEMANMEDNNVVVNILGSTEIMVVITDLKSSQWRFSTSTLIDYEITQKYWCPISEKTSILIWLNFHNSMNSSKNNCINLEQMLLFQLLQPPWSPEPVFWPLEWAAVDPILPALNSSEVQNQLLLDLWLT